MSVSSSVLLPYSRAPGLAGDPHIVQQIMLHENLIFPQAANAIAQEFTYLVDRLHIEYSTNPNPGGQRTSLFDNVSVTRDVHSAFRTQLVGGDRNYVHILRRIMSCKYIVEALYITRLGLTAGASSLQGKDYEMWWEDQRLTVQFLYSLRILNIGPVRSPLTLYLHSPLICTQLAAACIFAQAVIVKRVKVDLNLTLHLRHFRTPPMRIQHPDIQNIVKEVLLSFHAPLLVRPSPCFISTHTPNPI